MENKKNPNKVTLKVTDRELEMLYMIKEKEGHPDIPSVVHSCIRSYFNDSYYNKYRDTSIKLIKEPEPELTIEQWVEKMGGTIKKIQGVVYAYIGDEGEHWKWAIDDPEGVKKFFPKGGYK